MKGWMHQDSGAAKGLQDLFTRYMPQKLDPMRDPKVVAEELWALLDEDLANGSVLDLRRD